MQIQKDDEQTIIRTEQERKQKRSTKPRKKRNVVHDINLANLKNCYEQGSVDIKEYQTSIRMIAYAYTDVLESTDCTTDTDWKNVRMYYDQGVWKNVLIDKSDVRVIRIKPDIYEKHFFCQSAVFFLKFDERACT